MPRAVAPDSRTGVSFLKGWQARAQASADGGLVTRKAGAQQSGRIVVRAALGGWKATLVRLVRRRGSALGRWLLGEVGEGRRRDR